MFPSPSATEGAALKENPVRSGGLVLETDQMKDCSFVAGNPRQRDRLTGDAVVEGDHLAHLASLDREGFLRCRAATAIKAAIIKRAAEGSGTRFTISHGPRSQRFSIGRTLR